jgi:hypothetical protein
VENERDLQHGILDATQQMVFYFEDVMTEENFKFKLTDLLVSPFGPYGFIDSGNFRFMLSGALIRSNGSFIDCSRYHFQSLEQFGLQDPIFARFSRG